MSSLINPNKEKMWYFHINERKTGKKTDLRINHAVERIEKRNKKNPQENSKNVDKSFLDQTVLLLMSST